MIQNGPGQFLDGKSAEKVSLVLVTAAIIRVELLIRIGNHCSSPRDSSNRSTNSGYSGNQSREKSGSDQRPSANVYESVHYELFNRLVFSWCWLGLDGSTFWSWTNHIQTVDLQVLLKICSGISFRKQNSSSKSEWLREPAMPIVGASPAVM